MTVIYSGASPNAVSSTETSGLGFKYLSPQNTKKLRDGGRLATPIPGILGRFEVKEEADNKYHVIYNNSIFGGRFDNQYTAFGAVLGTYRRRGGTSSSASIEDDLKVWSPYTVSPHNTSVDFGANGPPLVGWWNSQNKTVDGSNDVTALADLSGNGNDMGSLPTTNLPSTVAASTLNGIQGIRFTSGEAMKTSGNVGDIDAQNFDMLVVVKGETSGMGAGIEYVFGWGSTTDGHAVGYFDVSSFGVHLYYHSSGGSAQNQSLMVGSSNLESSAAIIGLGKKDASYGRLMVDGAEIKQFLYDNSTDNNPAYLGTRAAVAPTLNATVYEAICFLNSSDADRQKAEGYLAHKYGIQANLPSDHPYKTIVPTV